MGYIQDPSSHSQIKGQEWDLGCELVLTCRFSPAPSPRCHWVRVSQGKEVTQAGKPSRSRERLERAGPAHLKPSTAHPCTGTACEGGRDPEEPYFQACQGVSAGK